MQKRQYSTQFYIGLIAVISILAMGLRALGMEHITADIETCLIPWSAEMATGYGVSILPHFTGDYNMPYVTVLWLLNYLPGRTIIKVKLFSVLFDYLGAVAGGLIVREFVTEQDKMKYFTGAYAAVLFYPSAVLNGAYWGQCDMIYVACLLFLIYALLKDRPSIAMILLGCAFSFKLQAVLILPILVIYYWKKRRISILHVLIVPVTMIIMCLPAIAGGSPWYIPFSIYLRQLGRYPYMYVFYPNLWAIFKEAPYYIFSSVANLSIISGLGLFAVAVIRKESAISRRQWALFGLWTICFTMFFLPCMHERYGMLLEIIAILTAFVIKEIGWCPIILGTGSFVAYMQTTFGKYYLDDSWIGLAYLLCLLALTRYVVRTWHNADASRAEAEYVEINLKEHATKAEKIVIDWLNQYLVWIAAVLLIGMAVIIRKNTIECLSPDYLPNLIEVDGNRHTMLYMLFMEVLGKIGTALDRDLMIMVKMAGFGCDLLQATMAGVYCYRNSVKKEADAELLPVYNQDAKLRGLMAFGILLASPATVLNTGIWGHLDSLTVALIFAGALCYRKRQGLAALFWGIALAFSPVAIAAIIAIGVKKEYRFKKKSLLVLIITWTLCCSTGLLMGYGLETCLVRSITEIGYEPFRWYILLPFAAVLAVDYYQYFLVLLLWQAAVLLDFGLYLYDIPSLPRALCIPLYAGGFIVGLLFLSEKGNKIVSGIRKRIY